MSKGQSNGTKWMPLGMLVVGIFLLATVAWAETQTVDGVSWTYSMENREATVTGAEPAEGTLAIPKELGGIPVTGIASNAFDGCASLTNVLIAGSVTNIGRYAFNKCTGLQSVTIPGSVKSIGYEAFSGCRGLLAVHIHDLAAWCEISFGSFYYANPLYQARHLFMDGEEVIDLVIPDGVTSIDYVTFVGGRNFKSVTIPSSMTDIGYRAFSVCSGLQAVYIHDLAAWCRIAFVTSESNPLDYAHHLFVDDEEVTDLVIPDSITSIGKYAFYACGGLASATIPGTVTGIGNGAFYFCSNLASVAISGGVLRIDGDAFYGCQSLKEVTIPASVESIGAGAFGNCLALEEIGVEPGNAKFESEGGVLFTKGKGELVQWPGGKGGDYEIPEGVTSIWDYSFYGCPGVTGVTIPGSVTNVGAYAFYDCAGLTNLVMDNGVESLETRAFQYCTGLTTMALPDSLRSIGEGVFCGCSRLSDVTIPACVTNIGRYAFVSCTNLNSLTLPDSVTSVGADAFNKSGLAILCVPESWEGTDILSNAGVPEGCEVVYRKASEATVTDVEARQRYPWNGLVDISCTVEGIEGEAEGLKFSVAAVEESGKVRRGAHVRMVKEGVESEDLEVTGNGAYELVWDARADLGAGLWSNLVVRVTFDAHKGVQLWEGGPYWAETNIGAEEPWEYGLYFWWGDTVGYKREGDAWVASDGSAGNFSFGSGNTPTYNKYNDQLQSEGWITAEGVLAPEHDAAQVQWGGGWRMPTDSEFSALISNCDWAWTATNGVNGYVVRGKGDFAEASIFVPAAGYGYGTSLGYAGSYGDVWSSVPGAGYSYHAWSLGFDSGGRYVGRSRRDYGFSVRPVRGFAE